MTIQEIKNIISLLKYYKMKDNDLKGLWRISKSISCTFRFFTKDGNIYSTIVSCILLSFLIAFLQKKIKIL